MKTRHIILSLFVIAALCLTAVGAYRIGSANVAAGGTRQAAAATEKKPLYWHDPMVPGQKFDKPGKSPFMDMQLVPVYGGDGDNDGTVKISPRIQQNLGIRTAKAVKGKTGGGFNTVGSVAYNESEVAVVQARGNGFIERLFVRAALDPVRKGQPLAQLYVPEWVAAQEEFLSARKLQDAGIGGLVDGARQRMRLAGMTDEQIQVVEASGKIHPRITISAPRSGVVAELAAREGMSVNTGAPMFRINGTGSMWVYAEVPENQAGLVKPGVPVEAQIPSHPGKVFKGKVSVLLPEVNPTTRTLRARIELANPDGQLAPGMFATLRLAAPSSSETILVPSESVIVTGERSVVMLAREGGRFVPVTVETGAQHNGMTEIRKGLDAGQEVVVSGQFLIDSEASLKGVEHRMTEPATKPAAPVHRGEGKVESIGKDEITLSHGPVPSLDWGAMTMPFKLPPAGVPRNMVTGDTVTFDFRQRQDGDYEIVAIAQVAPSKSTPAKPAGAKQ